MDGKVQSTSINLRYYIWHEVPLINLDKTLQEPEPEVIIHFMSLLLNIIWLCNFDLLLMDELFFQQEIDFIYLISCFVEGREIWPYIPEVDNLFGYQDSSNQAKFFWYFALNKLIIFRRWFLCLHQLLLCSLEL